MIGLKPKISKVTIYKCKQYKYENDTRVLRCVPICTCVCIYICIYIHTYIHSYTHVAMQVLRTTRGDINNFEGTSGFRRVPVLSTMNSMSKSHRYYSSKTRTSAKIATRVIVVLKNHNRGADLGQLLKFPLLL